jgi:hypothetical protein
MKVDTMSPLVDTQPAFQALVELKDQTGMFDAAAKRFLVSKLRRTIKEMRSNASYLEQQLKDMNLEPGD